MTLDRTTLTTADCYGPGTNIYRLSGTVSNPTLDAVRVKGGDDLLCGGDGNDLLDGGADSDVLNGGSGDYDQLIGVTAMTPCLTVMASAAPKAVPATISSRLPCATAGWTRMGSPALPG